MPYIYKITNLINGKLYIGKTTSSISSRWYQHCQDRYRFQERPLYRAMNKYGLENFTIETLEKVEDDSIACIRERYWIEHFGSFKYGYNATFGGDGKSYIDREIVLSLFNEGKNIRQISEIIKHSADQIGVIIKDAGVPLEKVRLQGQNKTRKTIAKIDIITEEILEVFGSAKEAGRSVGGEEKDSHILSVCKGYRKTAYGFKWKYIGS